MGSRAPQELLELMDLLDLLDLLEREADQVSMVDQEHREKSDQMGPKDHLETRERMD